MFDIGFTELLLIGVVALIVVGPERLPALAKTLGMWTGRLRAFVSNVKADIDKELKAEELKKVLDEQRLSNPLVSIIEDTKETLGEVRKDVEEAESSIKSAVEKDD